MITSLSISGFRGFQTLSIEDVGQVNLFVGRNGCGKTSVLEATALFASAGSPGALFEIMANRGELIGHVKRDYLNWEYDVSHLFRGHRFGSGYAFEIEGSGRKPSAIRCEVVDVAALPEDLRQRAQWVGFAGMELDVASPFALYLHNPEDSKPLVIGLSSRNGIDRGTINRPDIREREKSSRTRLIWAKGLDPSEMALWWNQVVLTPEENDVVEALKILEPDIERIAFLGRDRLDSFERRLGSSGIFVKMHGSSDRVPLGSVGGGMERLLGIALALSISADGYVMVDEIDTGLHFSLMSKMWGMVIRTAQRLNVQVFAATHSLDCLRGLAVLHRHSPELSESVRVHRLEKDLEKAITYSGADMVVADEHRVEVR